MVGCVVGFLLVGACKAVCVVEEGVFGGLLYVFFWVCLWAVFFGGVCLVRLSSLVSSGWWLCSWWVLLGSVRWLLDGGYEWFLRADLARFRGMYIAVVDGRVVEYGSDLEEVYGRARRRFPSREVVIWEVPREEILIL